LCSQASSKSLPAGTTRVYASFATPRASLTTFMQPCSTLSVTCSCDEVLAAPLGSVLSVSAVLGAVRSVLSTFDGRMLTVLNCLLDSLLGVLFSAGTALAALLAHRRADSLGEQELRGGRERALCAARDLLAARGACCVSLDLLSARSSRARFDAVKRAAAGSVACPCAGTPTRPLLLTCERTGSCSSAIFSKDLFFSVVLIWPFVIGGASGTQLCLWKKKLIFPKMLKQTFHTDYASDFTMLDASIMLAKPSSFC
jgi:hypothetical protein